MWSISDISLKTDIEELNSKEILEKITQLRPVSFRYSTEHVTKYPILAGNQFGFIAQELESIIPELVKTGSDGLLRAKYSALDPYFVVSIQNLIERVEELERLVSSSNNNIQLPSSTFQQDVVLSDIKSIVLNQNAPNPFTESTIISFNIPSWKEHATIIFMDSFGRQINSTEIINSGPGQLLVYSSDLTSGEYIYSLIVDGVLIESKKMMKLNH